MFPTAEKIEIVDAITKSFDGTGLGLLIEDVQVKVTRDGDANWLSCPANDYVARVLAR